MRSLPALSPAFLNDPAAPVPRWPFAAISSRGRRHHRLSRASRLGLAVALIDAGKNEEAIPLLRVVVSDEPAEEVAQFELGTALANQEQFESALVPFKAATVLRPDDAEAQLSTAKALVTLLRYAEAEPHLAAATRAGRTGADVATVQGMIASHTGRPSLAAAAFSEAVALNPNDAEAQLRLGERRCAARDVQLRRSKL